VGSIVQPLLDSLDQPSGREALFERILKRDPAHKQKPPAHAGGFCLCAGSRLRIRSNKASRPLG